MKLFSGGSKTVWVGQGSGQVPRRRANWIRRGIAVALDQIVVMVALLLVGLPAYVVTNGRIQSGGLPSAECVTLAEMPVGMSLPSGIRVKTIDACETNY